MLKKLTAIAILASVLATQFVGIAQAELTCKKDNVVETKGKACCGISDASTADPFDYKGVLKDKCGSGEIPMGMKTKAGVQVCPCVISLKPN